MGLSLTDRSSEVLPLAVGVEAAVFTHLDDQAAWSLSVNVFGLSVTVPVQFNVCAMAVGTDYVSVRGWTINVAIDDASDIGYTFHRVRLSRRQGSVCDRTMLTAL